MWVSILPERGRWSQHAGQVLAQRPICPVERLSLNLVVLEVKERDKRSWRPTTFGHFHRETSGKVLTRRHAHAERHVAELRFVTGRKGSFKERASTILE
jgi:hypothetical protein